MRVYITTIFSKNKWSNDHKVEKMCSHTHSKNTASVTDASVFIVKENARLRHSFTQRHEEHAGFRFKRYFCGLIFTDASTNLNSVTFHVIQLIQFL